MVQGIEDEGIDLHKYYLLERLDQHHVNRVSVSFNDAYDEYLLASGGGKT